MHQVIAFGEALIDMLALPGTGQRRFLEQPGGAPANVAVGVAKLGGRASFVGQVGEDMFGDLLVRAMSDYGVDTRHLHQTASAMTALAFVSLDADGERSFAFYRQGSADLLYQPEQCPQALLQGPAIFHCGSNTLTEPAIRDTTYRLMATARSGGCLISFDVNYRHNLWARGEQAQAPIWRAMTEADIIKLSREEVSALYGEDQSLIPKLLEGGVGLILVTDGGNPVQAHWRGGLVEVAPLAARVVDSTAAGDAFFAGFLHQLAQQDLSRATLDQWLGSERQLIDALGVACRCGAVAVSRYGAFDALPSAADLAGSMY